MKLKKLIITIAAISSLCALSFGLFACSNKKPGYIGVASQADIFTELNSKTADVGILDYTMAAYLLSQDTALTRDLTIADGISFDDEQYGIAFRKGSTGLCDRVNRALSALESTKIAEIASAYGLSANVLNLAYTPAESVNDADWNSIVQKGTFIVGYTLNPPMAIKNASDGSLSGFDIDLPKAVVDWLNEQYGTNLQIRFQLIDWDNKVNELNAGTIDCVWNGMTINEERLEKMTISTPYLLNRQCAVIRKADKTVYTDEQSLKSARVIAERGSAGEAIGQEIFK